MEKDIIMALILVLFMGGGIAVMIVGVLSMFPPSEHPWTEKYYKKDKTHK